MRGWEKFGVLARLRTASGAGSLGMVLPKRSTEPSPHAPADGSNRVVRSQVDSPKAHLMQLAPVLGDRCEFKSPFFKLRRRFMFVKLFVNLIPLSSIALRESTKSHRATS